MAVLLVRPEPAQPPVIVVLQGTGGAVAAAQHLRRERQRRRPRTGDAPAAAGERASGPCARAVVGAAAGRARSLGLISASGATVLDRERLPKTLLRGGTAALAVSLEPPGGSPTGAPTGPVLYAGTL